MLLQKSRARDSLPEMLPQLGLERGPGISGS